MGIQKQAGQVQNSLQEQGETGGSNVKLTNETAPQVWLTFLNPIWYLRQSRNSTRLHIDINYHFLRDNVEKGLISMNLYATNNQIADIFTKALSRE